MSNEPTPKFPGDVEVAAKAGEPGSTDWTRSGVGSVGVIEVRIVADEPEGES